MSTFWYGFFDQISSLSALNTYRPSATNGQLHAFLPNQADLSCLCRHCFYNHCMLTALTRCIYKYFLPHRHLSSHAQISTRVGIVFNTQQTKHVSQTQAGFTLLELVMVIIIIAILTGLALPSFIEAIRNNRAVNAAQQLQTALMTARAASVARGVRVSVAPLTTGVTHTENWANGWVVFVDTNSNGTPDADEAVILRQEPWVSNSSSTDYFFSTNAAIPSGRSLGVPSYVSGRPQAMNGALGSFSFVAGLNDLATGGSSLTKASTKHWRTLCVAVTGRLRMIKPDDPGTPGSGVCPGNN